MKKSIIFIILLIIVLRLNIAYSQFRFDESTFNWQDGDYSLVDWDSLSDWSLISPNRVSDVPIDSIKIEELSDEQLQYVTVEQWSYEDNLEDADDLTKYPNAQKAVQNKFPNTQITLKEGHITYKYGKLYDELGTEVNPTLFDEVRSLKGGGFYVSVHNRKSELGDGILFSGRATLKGTELIFSEDSIESGQITFSDGSELRITQGIYNFEDNILRSGEGFFSKLQASYNFNDEKKRSISIRGSGSDSYFDINTRIGKANYLIYLQGSGASRERLIIESSESFNFFFDRSHLGEFEHYVGIFKEENGFSLESQADSDLLKVGYTIQPGLKIENDVDITINPVEGNFLKMGSDPNPDSDFYRENSILNVITGEGVDIRNGRIEVFNGRSLNRYLLQTSDGSSGGLTVNVHPEGIPSFSIINGVKLIAYSMNMQNQYNSESVNIMAEIQNYAKETYKGIITWWNNGNKEGGIEIQDSQEIIAGIVTRESVARVSDDGENMKSFPINIFTVTDRVNFGLDYVQGRETVGEYRERTGVDFALSGTLFNNDGTPARGVINSGELVSHFFYNNPNFASLVILKDGTVGVVENDELKDLYNQGLVRHAVEGYRIIRDGNINIYGDNERNSRAFMGLTPAGTIEMVYIKPGQTVTTYGGGFTNLETAEYALSRGYIEALGLDGSISAETCGGSLTECTGIRRQTIIFSLNIGDI